MTKEEVITEFGEPEKIQYISCSFRPPHEDEDMNNYRKEEEEWKKNNAGERWIYSYYNLRADFNFMGIVLDWKRLR